MPPLGFLKTIFRLRITLILQHHPLGSHARQLYSQYRHRYQSFVGGRDFEIKEVNYATQAKRQNGSTMKPLLVYAPAIEFGLIGAGSPVVDVKFKVPGSGYSPNNYTTNDERGIIPAREALASSQNLAAIRLYSSVRNQNPGQFLEKMNITNISQEEYNQLPTAIGGIHNGITVEQNTNALNMVYLANE